MNCHTCPKSIEVPTSHSFMVVLQKVDTSGYSFFQCEDGQPYGGLSHQHFCCSKHCMHNATQLCIQNDYKEEDLHPIPMGMGFTNIHKLVLSEGLLCKVCSTPLTSAAYRFLVTRATPFNELPHSHADLEEWCCSLDHATQQVLSVLESYGNK